MMRIAAAVVLALVVLLQTLPLLAQAMDASKLVGYGLFDADDVRASKLVGYAILSAPVLPASAIPRSPMTHW